MVDLTPPRNQGMAWKVTAMGKHGPGNNGGRFLNESGTGDQVAFLSSILEASTEYSIVATDLAGTILAWNEGARRIYGYEAAEVVGKATIALLHHPDDVRSGQAKAILDEVVRTGKWEGTLRRVRKNGEPFTARVTKTLRRDPRGRPIGLTMISRDTIEQERPAAQLARQSRDRSGTPAVLVVDDDLESQKLVETALAEVGYRPVCMPDGESGLRAATKERPAAVVLDLRMPGRGGLEFLNRFRHTDIGGTTPVIVWTRTSYLTSQDQSRLAETAPLVVLKGRGGVEPLVKALQACVAASP